MAKSKLIGKILVTGANGVVGQPLVRYLSDQSIEHVCVSRKTFSNTNLSDNSLVDHVCWNLDDSLSEQTLSQIANSSCLVHCAPIWLLPAHLGDLTVSGIKRIIVFSSTSVISKTQSKDREEQNLVKLLSDAEAAIIEHCELNGVAYTILRPSMIYGYGRDENVSRIAGFINKRRFMLLMGKASGKRQPVHADDLVAASMAVLHSDASINKTYNLAGAEVLSYRVMVERIFSALGRPKLILSLPLWLFRGALRLAGLFSSFNYSPEMADRMNQDLIYSNRAAEQDFGYQPQNFLTKPERDLHEYL